MAWAGENDGVSVKQTSFSHIISLHIDFDLSM